jgi:hypothetical protein
MNSLTQVSKKLAATALVAVAVSVMTTSTARAHGSNLPAHEVGAVQCRAGGQMAVYPPRLMRSWYSVNFRNAEKVQWSPTIYRWQGQSRGWRVYDDSPPWYYAFTSSYGYYQAPYGTAWQQPNGRGFIFHNQSGLPRGIYAVRNYMYWDRTRTNHSAWGGMCTFY